MSLFLIHGNSDDVFETNMDLLVQAGSPSDAMDYWRDYFKDWDFPPSVKVWAIPGEYARANGALAWDNLTFVQATP